MTPLSVPSAEFAGAKAAQKGVAGAPGAVSGLAGLTTHRAAHGDAHLASGQQLSP